MDKGLYLGLIANKILPKSEYKKLTAKFTKGTSNGVPLYDINKMYKVLSKVEKLKPYVECYDEVKDLIEHGRIDEARKIVEGKQQVAERK